MRTTSRYVRVLVAVAICSAVLTACGSSGGPSSGHETNETVQGSGAGVGPSLIPASGASATPVATSASTPPLQLSGTFTESANDTTFSQTWRVGPAEQGSASGEAPSDVPSDVLDACNQNYSSTIATLAFVPGTVELKYTQGSLPQIIGIVNDQLISPVHGIVAFDTSDGWDCGDATGGAATSLTLQAGADQTVPFWILLPILSNANPVISSGAEDDFRFVESGISLPFGGNVKVTGPGALCLPGQSPTSIALFVYRNFGGKISCE